MKVSSLGLGAALLLLPMVSADAAVFRDEAANISRGDSAAIILARDHRWKDSDRRRGPPKRRGRRGYDDDDERGQPGHRKRKGKHKVKRGRGGPPGHSKFEFRRGGPPPWAPAHGWRRKHRAYSGYKLHRESSTAVTAATVAYVPPFQIDQGNCNRNALGTAIGGLAGAAIGSQLSREASRDQRVVAVIGGTILGALVGGSIGRSMDQVDQNCIGQALEHARDQQKVTWQTDKGAAYEVKPTGTYRDDANRYCREYQTTIIVGGQPREAYGKACRQPDGSWEKVS